MMTCVLVMSLNLNLLTDQARGPELQFIRGTLFSHSFRV